MKPELILLCILSYFAVLLGISHWTTKGQSHTAYFDGNKSSKWYVLAFGMLGDSLSGVTFISVPGAVILAKMGYLQIVFGYLLGYALIITALLPLYYRKNLISIYAYLGERYGQYAQYSGSFFFMLSRILGSAARLYLAVTVLQLFLFNRWNIPFFLSVGLVILAIWMYTMRGGIKTLVWTDTFQSFLLIAGVFFSIYAITQHLGFGVNELCYMIRSNSMSQIFFWDFAEKSYFWKQFLGGAFIALCMTGLDQNMMQKNLSCKTIEESQKNLFWFSIIMVITNVFFVSLGLLLYFYAEQQGISLPIKADGSILTDNTFPFLALNHLGIMASIAFIVGLTAATFSSADSVLTTLTTSFYIDVLRKKPEDHSIKLRNFIHLGFALILLIAIMIIKAINSDAVIDIVLRIANYTYGPLLGLFVFGILTKRRAEDVFIPLICFTAPFIAYLMETHPPIIQGRAIQYGNTILIINGFITFLGLLALSLFQKKRQSII